MWLGRVCIAGRQQRSPPPRSRKQKPAPCSVAPRARQRSDHSDGQHRRRMDRTRQTPTARAASQSQTLAFSHACTIATRRGSSGLLDQKASEQICSLPPVLTCSSYLGSRGVAATGLAHLRQIASDLVSIRFADVSSHIMWTQSSIARPDHSFSHNASFSDRPRVQRARERTAQYVVATIAVTIRLRVVRACTFPAPPRLL